MSDFKAFKALSLCVTACIGMLAVGACVIPLRGDESQAPSAASIDQASDPLASKLRECRSVTSEQKDALADCRKARAERRRQFLRPTSPTSSESATSHGASPLFVAPQDDSGPTLGPPGYSSIPQFGKE